MGKIFISYRRDDSLMLAKSMYDWLSHRYPRNDIFMDVDSIAPGVDFRAPIESAIIQSDIVFVLTSSATHRQSHRARRDSTTPTKWRLLSLDCRMGRSVNSAYRDCGCISYCCAI